MNDYISNYKIVERVWDKGFTALYRAELHNDAGDPESNLTFLLKAYHQDNCSGMIEYEKFISQKLEETCSRSLTIPILKSFTDKDTTYAVMQFKKNGLFLNELIGRLEDKYGKGGIPLKSATEIIIRILDSLEVLHHYKYDGENCGYLHLDLNPRNIFFESVDLDTDKWGTVKFIDFASSRSVTDNKAMHSNQSIIMQTDFYSASEICDNIPEYINKGTDLYSVCMCLLRLLSGGAFNGIDTKETVLEHYSFSDGKALAQILRCIIESASCIPSYYRYQDALHMKEDLQKLLDYIEFMEEGAYFEALNSLYGFAIPIDLFYRDHIDVKHSGLINAADKLKAALLKDRINYTKCLYQYRGLVFLAEHSRLDPRLRALLLESGISCMNKLGYSYEARKLYEEFLQGGYIGSIGTLVTYNLRYASTLADFYEFEEAYQKAQSIIEAIECFKRIANPDHSHFHMLELGRAYSASGNYLACLGTGNPLECFEAALREFGNDPGNCRITLTKMMHYAVEMDDRNLYEQCLKNLNLAGITNAMEYCNYLMTAESFEPFSLFIAVKGLYQFDRERIHVSFVKRLDQYMDGRRGYEKEHPEQLICKYVALMALYLGVMKTYEKYKHLSLTILKEGRINLVRPLNILMLISFQSKWIFNQLERMENGYLHKQLQGMAQRDGWSHLQERLIEEQGLEHILRHEYV